MSAAIPLFPLPLTLKKDVPKGLLLRKVRAFLETSLKQDRIALSSRIKRLYDIGFALNKGLLCKACFNEKLVLLKASSKGESDPSCIGLL